jgi:hypothetical protein
MVIGYSLALLVALGYASTYEGLSFTYWATLRDLEVEPIMLVVPSYWATLTDLEVEPIMAVVPSMAVIPLLVVATSKVAVPS